MSKWLLPPQEWPKVTKQPLATRVHGVKGDEEARRVAEYFEAPLAHFLKGQTQLRVNSGLDVYGSHQQLDGIKVNYTYQNGMEYLDIHVSQELAKQLETVEDFWDYALVELALPSVYSELRGNYLICYAHLTTPQEASLTDISEWPVDGVASNERVRTTRDPIINAADSAAAFLPISVAGDPGIASFIVDLRPSRGGAVTLDLYPYLYCSDPILPLTTLLWLGPGYIVEDPSGTMGPVHADVQPPMPDDDPASWTTPPVYALPVPTTHFDFTAGRWVFDATGTNKYAYDNGYFYDGWLRPFTTDNPAATPLFAPGRRSNADMYSTGDPLFTAYPWHKTHNWNFWYIYPGTPYVPGYSGPAHVPAKLEVSLFKGVPPFTALRDNSKNFRRWGDPTAKTFAPKTIIDTTVPAYSNLTFPGPLTGLLSHFYDIPLRGSVTLDTHRLIRGRPEIIENVTFKSA